MEAVRKDDSISTTYDVIVPCYGSESKKKIGRVTG